MFTTRIRKQHQQILNINWDKLHATSQNIVSTLANSITRIPGLNNTDDHAGISAITNFGIPMTASLSLGFAIGFMKG